MLSEINIGTRKYFVCDEINRLGIKNCFTTKLGGKSKGKVEGLNLGFRVGDDEKSVISNYRTVADDMGFDFCSIVASKQEHTNNIKIVTNSDRGKGVTQKSDIEATDGLVTGEKNLPLVVFSADCYPVLLADKEKKAVAAVHSGWKGTLLDISGCAVRIMIEEFGIKPENIIAAVGAGIAPCCFETKADVAEKFDARYIASEKDESFYINLPLMISDSLKKAGILEENIHISGKCTVCENDIFYSYRSQREKTGRLGAFISL